MNKQKWKESLLPEGIPKWIRCYDNGGESADRYTVIFTHAQSFLSDGYFPVLGMSENPFHPQGVCIHSEFNSPIDRPSYKHLGKKITYEQLPEKCKELVLSDYKYYWNLD